jgi:glycosyltransferase involved in cell wall biosynthesis
VTVPATPPITGTVPTLSIAMPVRNGERFIRQALDSLLAQTVADLELIISDNHSDDQTEQICRAYASRDARIRYVRQDTNIGLYPNVELVMRAARGRYLMLVGDDDVYQPGYAERLIGLMAPHPHVGLCYSDFAYVRPDGTHVAGGTKVFMSSSDSRMRNLGIYLLKRPVLPVIMGVYRTEIAHGALPFVSFGPMEGGIDVVFLARVLSNAHVHSSREVLFSYRLKDRTTAAFPADWPSTWAGRHWYLLRINLRLSAAMCRAIMDSDLRLLAKLALTVATFGSLLVHSVALPAMRAWRRPALGPQVSSS